MVSLAHPFSVEASVFPGDPAPEITTLFNIDPDGFYLENVNTGTHTGTHLDAPGHFIEDGRTVDELTPEEFVWTAYVVDVRDRIASEGPDFQLTQTDIETAESTQGEIPDDAMVILWTGFDALYGTEAYLGDAPGFSGETVQWLFDERGISGVGSDTFGPDATSDSDYSATYTALLNNGVTLPGVANIDTLYPDGGIIIAPAVPLANGSGYQVNPLACLN